MKLGDRQVLGHRPGRRFLVAREHHDVPDAQMPQVVDRGFRRLPDRIANADGGDHLVAHGHQGQRMPVAAQAFDPRAQVVGDPHAGRLHRPRISHPHGLRIDAWPSLPSRAAT